MVTTVLTYTAIALVVLTVSYFVTERKGISL